MPASAQITDTVDTADTASLPPVVNTGPVDESAIPTGVVIMPRTHPEKIVFSQFKLSKDVPDFEAFAANSPFVEKAEEIDKTAMMLSEYNRLSNRFNLYDENQDIVVHTQLKVDQYSSMNNLLVFDELDEKTFFRFSMYGYNVGIVPENVQQFNQIRISPSRATEMFRELSGNQYVTAEFVLKPIYADKKEPFTMNGNDFWLMFARIGEVRLWTNGSRNAKLVWFYHAPWYTPSAQQGLDNLFSQQRN